MVNPTKESDYDITSEYGVYAGITTKQLIGVGGTFISNIVSDKIDSGVTFKNEFKLLDFYLKLPVPNIGQISIGAGLGNNNLNCDSDKCFSLYRSLIIKKDGEFASHYFIKGGIPIGKIYNLHFGFHLLKGNDFVLTDPSFSGTRTINQSFTAFDIGIGILF